MATFLDNPMNSHYSKPVALIRKLTKSFRSSRRRYQNVVIADSCQFEPSPSKKSKIVDCDSSLNNFLQKLKEQLGYSKNEIVDEPSLISCKPFTTSRKTDLIDLISAKCFIDILKFLPPKDLQNVRLVCQSFNKIVQNHALDFQKKRFFQMEIVENDFGKIGIRSFGMNSPISPLKLELIDRPLRHIEALNIIFRGLTITAKTVKYLHRSINYSVNEMKFFDCTFQFPSNDLRIMVQRWHLDSLEFHQCQWIPPDKLIDEDDYFVTDRFFSSKPNIRFLCFDFSLQDEQKLGITDKLIRFFQNPAFLPETFVLNNCVSFITSKTLFGAISAFIDLAEIVKDAENLPYFYSWTFGRLFETKDQILIHLSPYLDYAIVKDVTDDRINLTFKVRDDFPVLYLAVHLHPFLPIKASDFDEEFEIFENDSTKNSLKNETDDEIDWDDSFTEDN